MRIGPGARLAAGVLAASLAFVGSTYALRPPSPTVTEAATVEPQPIAAPTDASPPTTARSGAGEVERLIRAFEDRVAIRPDPLDLTFLGRLYLQRARSVGDIASYRQAEEALSNALALYPTDPEAGTLLATARFATHDFSTARELANQILERDPTQLPALAVLGDAQLELGDYEAAAETYRRLAAQLPDAAGVQARLARLAFLHGDVAEARSLAEGAFEAAEQAGVFGAELSWYRTLQGQIEQDRGAYGSALARYRDAVRIAPDYHVARAGLGRALAALGRIRDAIRAYQHAIALVPEPSSIAALGDLHATIGGDAKASEAYATVRAIATLADNASVYDRQYALFLADHDRGHETAWRIAVRALEERHDVFGYDAAAWASYRTGRLAEARSFVERALALGTPDARIWFHAGMISAAFGDDARARSELRRALAIGPRFDALLAPLARRTLANLEPAR